MHVLSAEQFGQGDLSDIFALADTFRNELADPNQKRELAQRYVGHSLVNLFYEPSTRTRLSFSFAAANLGLAVHSTENAREFSSASKGETLEDTIRVIDEYGPDIIVLRHFETGAARRASTVSSASIINAGDGKGEHPTQSLLDAYTIQREHGRLGNLHVVMGGDLKHGRTVRSLARLLTKYDCNHISFVSVPELQMEDDVLSDLSDAGTSYHQTSDLYEVLDSADVVYWTRLQKERLSEPDSVPDDLFTIDLAALDRMAQQAVIMHPLPRIGEIKPEVDDDHRARYFEQAGNGLYVRMALIDQILKER